MPQRETQRVLGVIWGGWMLWLPLMLLGFFAVWRGQGYGAPLLPLLIYLPLSFALGGLLRQRYRADTPTAVAIAVAFFGGPLFALQAHWLEARYWQYTGSNAAQQLQVYCGKHAEATVYETVADVAGLLQVGRHNAYSLARAGREDVPDPWYQWSWHQRKDRVLGVLGAGYFFVEEAAGAEGRQGSIRRRYVDFPPRVRARLPEMTEWRTHSSVQRRELDAGEAISRFGFRTTNLTTRDMRRHWISGGMVEVLDLDTGRVLGVLRSFYLGKGAYSFRPSWERAGAGPAQGKCRGIPDLLDFLKTVLIPPRSIPTTEQVEAIKDGTFLTRSSARRADHSRQ